MRCSFWIKLGGIVAIAVAVVSLLSLAHSGGAPAQAVGENSVTAPDTGIGTGRVGWYSSLALDGAGFPVISHYDELNDDLRIVHCNDANCAGGDESITSPDTGGDVGAYTSLALDASGFPVVSYYSASSADLKILHCNDVNCAGGDESITTPDAGGAVGSHSSLELDGAGRPVVSYFDDTNDDLKILHCNDANCAGGDESITSPDTAGSVGNYGSLALDESGFPVVSYRGASGLQVMHCNDANCSGADESVFVADGSGTVVGVTSLELDGAGRPVVSYMAYVVGAPFGLLGRSAACPTCGGTVYVRVLHCNDVNCADQDDVVSTLASDPNGTATSLALDGSGFPVVTYYDGPLTVLRCNDTDCMGGDETFSVLDGSGTQSYAYAPVEFDTDGFPVVGYLDNSAADLKLLHCNDAQCVNGDDSITTPDRGEGGIVGEYTSLALDANGYPIVSYYDSTNRDLRVLHCNDANCTGGDESIVTPALELTFGDVALTLDGAGLPVIAYRTIGGNLHVVHCGDAACSPSVQSPALASGVDDISIVLDTNGFPVITYEWGGNTLGLTRCNDVNCQGNDDTSLLIPKVSGNTGSFNSLALDSNGFPVVSYWERSFELDLQVLHCNEPYCSGGDDSISVPDSVGDMGAYTSLELDANGFPVVSYFDGTSGDLKVMHCNDANCIGGDETFSSPDTAGTVGWYTSLAIDANGFPVVSYFNATGMNLKVLHCNDVNCLGGDESIWSPDTVGDVGRYTSLALDASGFPVVSYYDATNGDLKVLHCGTATCGLDGAPTETPQPPDISTNTPTSTGTVTPVFTPTPTYTRVPGIPGSSITSPDTAGNVGWSTSIKLDASGYPVVSYRDLGNRDLKILHCDDVNCAEGGNSITSPDTVGDVGDLSSLELDANGFPVVSYEDATNRDLKVMHCNDPNCSGGDESIVSPDTAGLVGGVSSLELDASGFPVVSYSGGGQVKVMHCNDPNCAGGDESIVSTTELAGAVSMRLDANGYPVMAINWETDLKVMHCDDQDCAGGNESIQTVEIDYNVGFFPSLELDANGNPVISYFSDSFDDLKLLHCNDANCAPGGDSYSSPDGPQLVGAYTSLVLDSLGHPVVSYYDETSHDLKVMRCNDANCTGGDELITSADIPGDVGRFTSITLDADGFAVVSYFDFSNVDLKVLHCDTLACTPLDTEGDGVADMVDNCPYDANSDQGNADRNFLDQSPPSSQDDWTWPRSDILGDACDTDSDNDGLSNTDEGSGVACGGVVTDPLLRDTDGDRVLDGAECARGTDPTSASSKPTQAQCGSTEDADKDRLPERVEVCGYNTNPNLADTDGDQDGSPTTGLAKDGCEAASLNNDRIVNAGDQLLLVLEILREPSPSLRLVSFDVNKDGAVNAGDQLMVAGFIATVGACP